MTATSENIPRVLARYQRAAVKVITDLGQARPDLDEGQRLLYADALATLEAMPEQIEQLQAVSQ